jgi:hypothetical protein
MLLSFDVVVFICDFRAGGEWAQYAKVIIFYGGTGVKPVCRIMGNFGEIGRTVKIPHDSSLAYDKLNVVECSHEAGGVSVKTSSSSLPP